MTSSPYAFSLNKAKIKRITRMLASVLLVSSCASLSPQRPPFPEQARENFTSAKCREAHQTGAIKEDTQAINSCLAESLRQNHTEYFLQQFPIAWQNKKVSPEAASVWLAYSLRANNVELARALFEQGVKLNTKSVQEIKLPNDRGIDFTLYSRQGFELQRNYNPELINLIFNHTESVQDRKTILTWLAYWAISHYDNNLLRRVVSEADKAEKRQAIDAAPAIEYWPELIVRAIKSGNVEAVSILGKDTSDAKALSALIDSVDPLIADGPQNVNVDIFSRDILDKIIALYSVDRMSWTYNRRIQRLLLAVSGDNKSQQSNPEAVRYLLSKGVPPEIKDRYSIALYIARAKNSSLDLLKEVKEAGADLKRTYDNYKSLLYYAALGGHDDIFEWLLTQGLEPMYEVPPAAQGTMSTDLIEAAIKGGNMHTLTRLLDYPLPGTLSKVPLAIAVVENKPDLIRLLYQRGERNFAGSFVKTGEDRNIELFKLLFNLLDNAELKQTLVQDCIRPDPISFVFGGDSISLDQGADELAKSLELEKRRDPFYLEVLGTGLKDPQTRKKAWELLSWAESRANTIETRQRLKQWQEEYRAAANK